MTHLRFDKLTNLPFELPGDKEDMKNIDKFHAQMSLHRDDTSADRPGGPESVQGILDGHVNRTLSPDTWDQMRVNDWQDATFGLANRDPLADRGVMDKLEEEVGELRKALVNYQQDPTVANLREVQVETADCQLLLYHMAGIMGFNIQPFLDEKMVVNEARKWDVSEGGSGKHVG